MKRKILIYICSLCAFCSLAPNSKADVQVNPPAKVALKIETIWTKDVRLTHPIIVQGNFEEVRENGQFDINKLKILLGGYEIKTKAILSDKDKVTFHWDDSVEAQKDTKILRKRFLLDGNREGDAKVDFRVAYDGKIQDLPNASTIRVLMYDEDLFYWCLAFLGIFVSLFLWLAKTSDVIRDSTPPYPLDGTSRPYSLGKLQMALWFFIIIGSFLWLWAITTEIPNISNTALILMGLSVGTGALAVVVDTSKQDAANNELNVLIPERDKLTATMAELQKVVKLKMAVSQKNALITSIEAAIAEVKERITAAPGNAIDQNELNKLTSEVASAKTELRQIEDQISVLQPVEGGTVTTESGQLSQLRVELAETKAKLDQKVKQISSAVTSQTKPISQGFQRDILTDMNGISFHRFQMLLWTFVLIAVFLEKVWTTFAMPDLDPLLLALTGISGATYIGFKVPERQT